MPLLPRSSKPDVVPCVSLSVRNFSTYRQLISKDLYEEIIALAAPLRGLRVGIVNATSYGGGVAEILHSFTPLLRSLDIDARWYTMPAREDFFTITKNFHNALQGAEYELTPESQSLYLKENQRTAQLLRREQVDIWEIHDPQPAAMVNYLKDTPAIWRCHIDTSHPNQAVWQFLLPYLQQYQQLVFTMPEFIEHSLIHDNIHCLRPTIDPLSLKNVLLTSSFAARIVAAFGFDLQRPLITQVSRFDVWKDPKGVVDAYRIAKKDIPGLQLALVGALAFDDPEAAQIIEEVNQHIGSDNDVALLSNLDGVAELEVNAFQTVSDIIIQKSLREGFGLTVTEAMWKGRPVIGGNTGGIKSQINHEENGILVTSVEETAEAIVRLLKQPSLSSKLGRQAHRTVTQKFLLPRLLRDHLALYHETFA